MSRRVLGLVAFALIACSRKPPPPPAPAVPDDAAVAVATPADAAVAPVFRDPAKTERLVDKDMVATGKTFMVTSESAVATNVGRDILASGGNAVDAAVAVAFALAVVHPTAGNLGGGGFAVVRTEPGKAFAVDFREVAPGAATETMYLDAAGNPTDASIIGHRASGVPGAVAGLWELHGKLGKKKWADLLAPAIALARDGFEVDAYTAKWLARPRLAQRLMKFPASAAIWYPSRIPRAAGTKVAIPTLAATLERIAAKGADGFYKGETAAAIAAEMKAGGGIITEKDLANYRAIWRDPLRFSYRGYSVVSMPPPSSGGIVLGMTAGMLREIEVGKLPWYGTEHVHRLAEVWKRAFAVRNEVLGDPKYVKDLPIAKLFSNAYLDKLSGTITDKASPSAEVQALVEGDHTTHLNVVDPGGMAVALTTTLNTAFGSGVTVAGAGFLLNNEMDDFTVKPGVPNVFGLVQGVANKIEPGKRMLSSMSPSIVEDAKGKLVLLAGAGGGPRIITAVWQTISNVIDFDQSIALAVASSRVHHQHLPDVVRVEPEAIDKTTDAALRARGHMLDWSAQRRFGAVTAIGRTKTGWEGTADPRASGAAMGD